MHFNPLCYFSFPFFINFLMIFLLKKREGKKMERKKFNFILVLSSLGKNNIIPLLFPLILAERISPRYFFPSLVRVCWDYHFLFLFFVNIISSSCSYFLSYLPLCPVNVFIYLFFYLRFLQRAFHRIDKFLSLVAHHISFTFFNLWLFLSSSK